MAIAQTVDIVEAQLWPQGDIRDPLGTWGFRHGVTGDASGDGIKVGAQVPIGRTGSFVYTCYSLLIAALAQASSADFAGKARLLTNWPNVDPQAGIQGFATGRAITVFSGANFTAPVALPLENLIAPPDRFVLLFDPRTSQLDPTTLVELETNVNVLADTYSFEGYGYYWDRSVLQAPGGLRHPGAS